MNDIEHRLIKNSDILLAQASVMQRDEDKLVSVIIPALHRPDLTRQCIRSIGEQKLPPQSYEIIVVENEVRSDAKLADPLPDNTRVIELSENYGTTGSINRACADSASVYVLLLNNDVELHPCFLSNLVSVLEQNENCGFATGKLLNACYRDHLDGAGDAVLAGGGTYRLGHDDVDSGQYNSCRQVIAGCGAATLVRRSVLDEVAGLDEDFFAYLDDLDLGLRIHLCGYRGIYVPNAVAFHIGSATLDGNSFHPNIVEWLSRNQILLLVKDYPLSVFIRLFPRILCFQLLWLSFVVARGAAGSYLKGLLGAIRLFPRMIQKRRGLMRRRRLGNAEFLSALLSSEQQVYEWHKSQPPGARSSLLNTYFWLFRKGCT